MLLAALELDLRELRQSTHEVRDLIAELLANLVLRRKGVFDGVVEQPDRDRHGIQSHLRQQARHGQGVGEVRLAGESHLSLVDAGRIDVCLVQNRGIGVGKVLLDLIDDVVDPRQPNGPAQSKPKCWRWEATTRRRATRDAPTTCNRSATARSTSSLTMTYS